ncbi:MAG TPA: hypothetical protein VHY48_02185 [Acidobacteriaceae bacterium]|jgi:hypothetical protein|nr:hypothetical protein [Acidobacteriaceae bacterium]
MATQGELFTEEARKRAMQQGEGPQAEPAPAPVWLQRLSLVVLVLFCFYIGGLLIVLPWSPRYFDANAWLLAHPAVSGFLGRSWMRGILSGIGLIDIWIGVSELLHYRDYRS